MFFGARAFEVLDPFFKQGDSCVLAASEGASDAPRRMGSQYILQLLGPESGPMHQAPMGASPSMRGTHVITYAGVPAQEAIVNWQTVPIIIPSTIRQRASVNLLNCSEGNAEGTLTQEPNPPLRWP